MDFSSGSGWQSNPHLYGRRSYERHPRPDHAAHRGTRATTTGGDQVSDASDYIDPLALGPSLETMPVFPPLCFPQADPKSMTTATPHTRSMQALEAPPEDGPIYLHLPQYNGYTNHSGWSDAQCVTQCRPCWVLAYSLILTGHTRRPTQDKAGCPSTRATPRCLPACK